MISNLSEVPPTWIKVRFDEIAENITDRIDKPKESGLEYYIGLEHLDTDQIRIKRFGSTDDVNATKFLCKKGDIIFGKRRSYLRKVAVTDRDAVVSAHSMVIRPKGDLIVPDFLPCFMQSSVFWKTAHAISEGSMSPTIKWKILAKQEFWIPSIEEQKKISRIFYSIEETLEKIEELIHITKMFRVGLLTELMTKGISHSEFKKTDIGNIPSDWSLCKLEEISNVIRDGTHRTPKYTEKGVPFLRVTDIQTENIDWESVKYISENEHEELCKRVLPECGDVLLSKNGTVGIAKIVDWKKPFSIFVSLCLIKPKHEKIFNKYLLYFLQSDACMSQILLRSKTGTVTNLHLEEIRDILIPLASIKEQEKIVDILDEVDKSLSVYNIHEVDLKKYEKKIIDEILSNKIGISQEALQNVQ
jgi:type I restriction enzyme S subunit